MHKAPKPLLTPNALREVFREDRIRGVGPERTRTASGVMETTRTRNHVVRSSCSSNDAEKENCDGAGAGMGGVPRVFFKSDAGPQVRMGDGRLRSVRQMLQVVDLDTDLQEEEEEEAEERFGGAGHHTQLAGRCTSPDVAKTPIPATPKSIGKRLGLSGGASRVRSSTVNTTGTRKTRSRMSTPRAGLLLLRYWQSKEKKKTLAFLLYFQYIFGIPT